MRPSLDFTECLKDSPRFRAALEDTENDIDVLEAKLEKLVKLCSAMIDAGKLFNNANSGFINGLRDVSLYFKEDELVPADSTVGVALERFTHVLSEVQKYHNILLDQANRSVCKKLNHFIKNDIKKVKETRRHFEKISADMDESLLKNAQVARSKPAECEETHNVLTAMKSCFGHVSLDYVFQVNILHSKKRFDILDTVLAYMHAQNTHFHQGYDLFSDVEPYMKQVASQLEELSSRAQVERKEMEDRHTLVQRRQEISLAALSPQSHVTIERDDDTNMEGYLFKRTTNAFKSWVRRWFMIQNNQLVYRKRTKDSLTVMEEDLRLCTVRPLVEIDRRFCFEVLSPSRSHILQADTEADYHAWMNAIQAGVSTAYNNHHRDDKAPDSHSDTQSGDSSASGDSQAKVQATLPPSYESEKFSRMSQILSVAGNNECCDCCSGEPRWASINLGITLCIECSGIHRSFGVHMSKVRSLTLDSWEQELLKVMLELGNSVINQIYEANVDENAVKRATPHCNREVREAWIRAKYIDRAFVRKLPQPEDHEKPLSPKTWSVKKWKRRSSPSKTIESPSPGAMGATSAGDAPVVEEKAMLAEGQSQDSGLGGSTQDVIVFGTAATERQTTTPTDEDEDSMSEPETDPDTQSTTSYEDFSKLHPDMLLYKAARARNLPVMREALALGANPNWQDEEEHHQTPLMKAIGSGSMVPVEFLLINGAKLDTKDDKGQSALHHATLLGHTGQVCQLLKRNANQQAVDENGMDPLSIAISKANADIVTILRLSKLNQEMKETEGMYGIQGDETFNEVFRDFTSMAHNAPEKLNRNK